MTARRAYGTGQLHEKHGAWYGRWRTGDGQRNPTPRAAGRHTVREASESRRQRLAITGASRSYLKGCESMERLYISPLPR
jgi:hypothetical protein